mmetsp:Transcript_23303/g.56229  ORF Transcript_23303/g.56229 Transcript_23303/m.56229 type:complete len:286 (+) Transcript_23303:47-904(+)|eukprot:CAMPEP_0181098864 /NCGR_PEP_ID=MMETSP1071-20121207/12356_1 /TAXON_ID=35127 /ORGANISM="Thalassiosira sp., Strain NH16" /LENGTH=285 /DNA_ID=CAMNT_0023181493 /DNA_START=244 /DNA_END=1101 /DNA_ORIENTATION=+
MINLARALLLLLPIWTTAFDVITSTQAFRTSQVLPMRMDPIPREEINLRLGLGASSVGTSGPPDKAYALTNEHEVVCPVSGAHRGVLCTASLSGGPDNDATEYYDSAESVSNDHDLVTQAIHMGSLATSVRSRCKDGNSVYYLPIVITLVESLMADEMEGFDYYNISGEKSTVFNSGGLETNEILMDWTDHDFSSSMGGKEHANGVGSSSVMLYACNTHSDHNSATSDIYVLPKKNDRDAKVWRFSVDYKVATINLGSIYCFGGKRSADSTTPLRPDVWLKDDYY